MKLVPRRTSLMVAALALAAVAAAGDARAAIMLTFEDLTPELGAVPQGYGGFQWGGASGTTSWVLATPGAPNDLFSPHGGTQYAWSNQGGALELERSAGVFDFISIWAYGGQGPGPATVRGFLDGVEIYTETFNLGGTYAPVTLNFTGIDRLVIDSTPGTNAVIDDISVSYNVAAVPEPSTLISGAFAALVGLGYGLRRREPRAPA